MPGCPEASRALCAPRGCTPPRAHALGARRPSLSHTAPRHWGEHAPQLHTAEHAEPSLSGVVRGYTMLDEGRIYVDPRAVRDLRTTKSHDSQSGCCGIPQMGGPHFRCSGGHTLGLVCTECSHGPNRVGFAPGEVHFGPAEGDDGITYGG